LVRIFFCANAASNFYGRSCERDRNKGAALKRGGAMIASGNHLAVTVRCGMSTRSQRDHDANKKPGYAGLQAN